MVFRKISFEGGGRCAPSPLPSPDTPIHPLPCWISEAAPIHHKLEAAIGPGGVLFGEGVGYNGEAEALPGRLMVRVPYPGMGTHRRRTHFEFHTRLDI